MTVYSPATLNWLGRHDKMLLDALQSFQLAPSQLFRYACFFVVFIQIAVLIVIANGKNYARRQELLNLRRQGVPSSNMKDQYDQKYASPEGSTTTGPIRIKAMFIHPIKSCGPIEVSRALLTKSGFLYDRCFAIAEEAKDPEDGQLKWRFISQRTKPAMALIKTELWLPHKESHPDDPLVRAGGCVVVRFRDPDPPSWMAWLEWKLDFGSSSEAPEVGFILPLDPMATQTGDLEMKLKPFNIHGRTARGIDMVVVPTVAEALPKLRKYLGIKESHGFAIYKCTEDTLTRTDKNLAPLKHIGTPSVHGYTDQQPVHLNSLSSVHAVSELLPKENQPLNGLRYRANIWTEGAAAFDEEFWMRYRVLPKGGSSETRGRVEPVLSVVCRTSRCTMPNVDPNKGTFDTDNSRPDKKKGQPQPSTTLIEHHTPENGNKAALGYLGMHCVPEDRELNLATEKNAELYVEVGDEIEVMERGHHLYGSTANEY